MDFWLFMLYSDHNIILSAFFRGLFFSVMKKEALFLSQLPPHFVLLQWWSNWKEGKNHPKRPLVSHFRSYQIDFFPHRNTRFWLFREIFVSFWERWYGSTVRYWKGLKTLFCGRLGSPTLQKLLRQCHPFSNLLGWRLVYWFTSKRDLFTTLLDYIYPVKW